MVKKIVKKSKKNPKKRSTPQVLTRSSLFYQKKVLKNLFIFFYLFFMGNEVYLKIKF